MLVQEAKAIARQWVIEEASRFPGFLGAFYAGSINGLVDVDVLPPTSDVDVMVVLNRPTPQSKLGKFLYQGVLIEATYLAHAAVQSADQVLGHYHLAGSFAQPSIIADLTGELTQLQQAVAQAFATHTWVEQRARQARDKVVERVAALDGAAPFHEQVTAWLFATGGMPHVLLVAGLQNPTVRQRYGAVRALLAAYGQRDYYTTLLELLGCDSLRREQATAHLAALVAAFDAAQAVIKTDFPFAADLSPAARPVAIAGSEALIARGEHREAVYWIMVTFARCQQVFYADGPQALWVKHDAAFRHLLIDLGIRSAADLHHRCSQVTDALPALWAMTQTILNANPRIHA